MTPSTPYSSGEGGLLPCPFCGGPARDCFNGDVPFPMFWVLCEKCHSSPGDRSSREEAAAAWNTRVVSPGLPVGEGQGSRPQEAVVPTEGQEAAVLVNWPDVGPRALDALTAFCVWVEAFKGRLTEQQSDDLFAAYAAARSVIFKADPDRDQARMASHPARRQAAASAASQVGTEPQSGAVHQKPAQQEQANDRR